MAFHTAVSTESGMLLYGGVSENAQPLSPMTLLQAAGDVWEMRPIGLVWNNISEDVFSDNKQPELCAHFLYNHTMSKNGPEARYWHVALLFGDAPQQWMIIYG
jgi:hypothetical protein